MSSANFIFKLENGAASTGEESEQQWSQNTTLWGTCVQDNGGEGASPDSEHVVANLRGSPL